MKQLFVLLLAVNCLLAVNGQNNNLKKLPSFGLHFTGIDFKTAQDLRSKNLATLVRDKQWTDFTRINPGVTLSYIQGLSNHIDVMTRLTGSFLSYPARNTANYPSNATFYFEGDANVNIKLLTDNYTIVPYLQAGVGFSKERATWMAYIPFGAGLQFNLWDAAFLHVNTGYRIPVTSRANYSVFHSIGISAPIVERKKPVVVAPPPPPAPEPPKDRDGDGVLDENDACPDVAGLPALKGCPDADKDGIADKDDKCPNEFGLARYQGCPIPDTDKDGINDEEDKCVSVPGLARYQGCPIPDTDADGVNDEEDKCPNVAGPASNAGCPIIGIDAYKVVFKSASAVLLPEGKKELDKAIAFLKTHEGFDVMIEGHTDNTGSDKVNNPLSVKRAEAVKAYFVKNGIPAERLFTSGFGSTKPVADNKTVAGRKLNRRIEVKTKH